MKRLYDYCRVLRENKGQDCCDYLEEKKLREIGKNQEFYGDDRILGNPITYYCSLTHKHCVGTKVAIFIFSSDKVDLSVVKRCPNRKTIEDKVEED